MASKQELRTRLEGRQQTVQRLRQNLVNRNSDIALLQEQLRMGSQFRPGLDPTGGSNPFLGIGDIFNIGKKAINIIKGDGDSERDRKRDRVDPPRHFGPGSIGSQRSCIWPMRRAPDGSCQVFVGERPGPDRPRGGTGGIAVQGAFGMPAMEPEVEMREYRSCGKGFVLGEDDLCYPKAILRRDSRFRKWKPGRRPVMTGGDLNAIRKGKRAINRGRTALGLEPLKRL